MTKAATQSKPSSKVAKVTSLAGGLAFKPVRGTEAWERQPFDTDKSWAAFVVYRELPVDERGYRATAAAMQRPQGYARTVDGWAAKHFWQSRVGALDAKSDREAVTARIEAEKQVQKEIHGQHENLASLLRRLMMVETQRHLHKAGADRSEIDFTSDPTINLDVLLRLADYTVRLDRANAGKPEVLEAKEVRLRGSLADIVNEARNVIEDLDTGTE